MSVFHNFHKKFQGKKIISVDFDGVLHHYTSEWAGPLVITDPPTPGAIPWLLSLVHHKRIVVVIHSCRLEDTKAAVGHLLDAEARQAEALAKLEALVRDVVAQKDDQQA